MMNTDVNPKDYLIGVYSKSLVTGKVKAWGECDAIRIILDGISYANNFIIKIINII